MRYLGNLIQLIKCHSFSNGLLVLLEKVASSPLPHLAKELVEHKMVLLPQGQISSRESLLGSQEM